MKIPPPTVLALLVCLLGSGCYSSQISKADEQVPSDVSVRQRNALPVSQRKKVAVLSFEDRTDYGQGRLGRSASNVLLTFLDRSGQFALYEREKLDKIIEEQKLVSAPGDAATAAQIGKTIGVDYVIIGAVTGYGYHSRRNDVLIFGSSVKQEAEATVDVRMVEVSTGRIVLSESGRGLVTVSSGHVLGVGSHAGYDETTAANALRAAIAKYVDKLIDQGLARE
jgi:curli biogenesis system outer membrane secretion channel CsgG